jgi:hypothetical protein
MDALDLDGVLGYGYYQFGYLGDGQLDSCCGVELERGNSYCEFQVVNSPRMVANKFQIVVGTSCVAIPMVLNGAIGAKLHIPFSVAVRASFGYYLAYFCIVSRSILAMFWLGIQGANGAQCITIMLTAIWPSYANIPNTIDTAKQGIDSKGMVR